MSVPYRVMSVGIQPESLEILNRQLSPKEYNLEKAEDLVQVKEILKQGIPDIIFLSTEIKAFDPFKLCLTLSRAGVAVLMISEAPTRQMLIKAAKHGAMDLLVSPLQPGSLESKIDRALIKTGKKSLPEDLELKMDFGYAETPSEKVKVLVKNVQKLLALPFAVIKIIRLCNDPSANAKDLEIPVKSDPAVTAMIMQRANSAAYGGMGQAKTIQRAIVRIGMRSTRNIAASFSVFKLFSKEEKNFGFNRVWFWIHSLTTGICAQLLATLLKYKQPEDAFIAGLLHDIGKMVLDDFMNEEFHKALLTANVEGIPMRMAEQSVFNVSHAYVGSKVAGTWGFPSLVAETIGRHHRYTKLADEGERLSMEAIVCIANQMAKALQAGSGGDHLAEREALPLWCSLPDRLPWKKMTEKVFDELKSYTDILEIPPDQFQITVPENEKGQVGIFVPKRLNYGALLEIAMYRQGFQPVKFSSLEDPAIKGKKLDLVIGDLSSIENDDEAEKLQEGMAMISDKSIILPRIDEKERPFNLDFFWLETQLKKAFE